MKPDNKYYKPKEVAKILGLHVDTIRKKIREGEIEAINISTKTRPNYRIPERSILEYGKQNKT